MSTEAGSRGESGELVRDYAASGWPLPAQDAGVSWAAENLRAAYPSGPVPRSACAGL